MSLLLVKALHIISLVAWFSGLFYLPRLFVYHCEVNKNEQDYIESYNRFCTMEYKLFYYITYPAAILTTIFGAWMLYSYAFTVYKTSGWLHAKLSLVVLLWAYHLYCGVLLGKFRNKSNKYSSRFYRFYNEVPTLFLVSIVILTIVKPF